MSDRVQRILGDSPVRIVLKLAVVSFLVGILMSAFGWTPLDVWDKARDAVLDVWRMGFSAFDRLAGYLLLGAAIVVPAYIVIRLLSLRR